MSSSKIFKEDPLFTPTSLIQRAIVPFEKETKTPGNDAPASPPVNPHPPTKAQNNKPPQAPPIDLEMIKREAYNQGMKDLADKYQAETQQTVKAFTEACQKIDNQQELLLRRSQGDIINLTIALSKKILGQELAIPRNIIATTLQAAIEQAIESQEYYVTLHPDDLAFAEEKAPKLIAAMRGLDRLVFKTDKNITRGGCLLDSSVCSIDATIETQTESIREFLEEQSDALPASKIV